MHDGVIGSVAYSKFQYSKYGATDIEQKLENLHSTGFITTMCQSSNTYFHLMLIRHGSVFQVQNPWSTSLYGSVWQQSIPRDIILGCTAGEAYSKGISHVGNLFLGGTGTYDSDPQWWWDNSQNTVFFGDPNLRVYVPSTEYNDENNWGRPRSLEKTKNTSFNGHTPFGAGNYPHSRQPQTLMIIYLLILLMVITIIVIITYFILKRRKK